MDSSKFRASFTFLILLSPSWEKENVKFDFTVKFPDFAMLEVKVLDNGSEEILGMSYIPIKHLQSGYRFIEIYDMTGQNITNSKGTLLFCEIAISNENEHSEGDIVRTVSPSNDISILDLKVKSGKTLVTDL